MKIVTWNIAGAHTISSSQAFDYQPEDIDYFVQELDKLNAEVICLQEVHTNPKRSIAKEIALNLGGYSLFDTPLSPSHIDPAFRLGMAILTKGAFADSHVYNYPKPDFDLHLADGRLAEKHQKALQVVTYKGVQIANTHLLPSASLSFDYLEGDGKKLAENIETVLLEHLEPPVILCGDLGMSNEYPLALGHAIEQLGLQNALPLEPTYHLETPRGGVNMPDCIYFSNGSLHYTDAGVVVTRTDHYLCWANLEI